MTAFYAVAFLPSLSISLEEVFSKLHYAEVINSKELEEVLMQFHLAAIENMHHLGRALRSVEEGNWRLQNENLRVETVNFSIVQIYLCSSDSACVCKLCFTIGLSSL